MSCKQAGRQRDQSDPGNGLVDYIACIEQLPTISERPDRVLRVADFKQGSRYGDFVSDIEDVAAWGLEALVTGKFLANASVVAVPPISMKKFDRPVVISAAVPGGLLERSKPSATSGLPERVNGRLPPETAYFVGPAYRRRSKSGKMIGCSLE